MTDTSVIIPVLNGERHIAEAYASIAGQLAPDDEILVVDNGSTDATIAIVEGFGDPRVRVLTESRPGPAAARNRALEIASGECIAFLDHDDLWPVGRHERMRQLLADGVDAVCGRIRVQFDAGVDPHYLPIDGAYITEVSLGPFLFRRTSILAAGRFDPSLHHGEDVDYLLRLRALNLRVAALDETTLIYRRHATNMTLDIRGRHQGALAVLRRNLLRKRGAGEGS